MTQMHYKNACDGYEINFLQNMHGENKEYSVSLITLNNFCNFIVFFFLGAFLLK